MLRYAVTRLIDLSRSAKSDLGARTPRLIGGTGCHAAKSSPWSTGSTLREALLALLLKYMTRVAVYEVPEIPCQKNNLLLTMPGPGEEAFILT